MSNINTVLYVMFVTEEMESVSLAEPRRRQKWTLNPRGESSNLDDLSDWNNVVHTGNMWSNDEDKFGQKLMEKMGWSKGKGLGANLDGRVQVFRAE